LIGNWIRVAIVADECGIGWLNQKTFGVLELSPNQMLVLFMVPE